MRRLDPRGLTRLRIFAVFALAAAAAGACSEVTAPDAVDNGIVAVPGGDFSATDVSPPTVAILAPANGATGVSTTFRVVIQFSELMNLSTINSSTFTLSPQGGSPVSGVIKFHSANRASFDVAAPMTAGTTYVVRVTSGAQDVSGNGVSPELMSTFTTAGIAPDVTSPTVTNVSPANSATGVAVGSDVVVTFSEAMNATTINTASVTLTPTSGGSPVAAVVSYSAGPRTATLNPSGSLASSTSYTVNVTTGAKDLAGNSLTAFSSTFTTGDGTSPTVTAVSPTNNATGIAVNADVVATFSEAMNGGTITTSTFTLTPTSGGSPVAAAVSYDSGAGTATLNPSAALAFSTSYTVNVTSGATDAAGNGLVPFASSFTTAAAPDLTSPTVTNVSPANNATGVGVASDVLVTFSEPMNAGTVTTSTFTLTPTSGGSPVAAAVSYNAGTATLNPSSNLAFSTSYTVNVTSGATDLSGNPLTAFTSSFTTAAAPDVTSPTVTAVNPLNSATGVAVGNDVIVTFSEPMNAASLTTSSFTLTPTSGGSPVAAVVSYSAGAGTATLNPSSSLAPSTSYTVNVTSAATDVAGNPLTPFSSGFTTSAPVGDGTPPTVNILVPANGATGVSTTVRVVIQFSELMNLNTINSSTFTLSPQGGSPVPGVILFHGANRSSFDVSSPMIPGTTYVVRVSSGAQDVSGTGVSPELMSTFTTAGTPPDATAPTVTNVSPANAATAVAVGSDVVVTFSEAMNATTINTASVTLTPTSGGSPVAAVVSYSAGPRTATLNPSGSLASSTSYTVNVTTGAKDLAGNSLTAFSSTFTTGDGTSPTVTAVSPTNNATGIAVNADVVATFSEAMNGGTITTSTFTLTPTSGGSPVAAAVSYDSGAGTATLNPSAALAFSTSYTVNVTSGATDAAGNGLVPFASSFTTAAAPDLTSPTVTNVSPANNATGVGVASDVLVTFSEPMNAGTVTTSTFTLTPTSGGSPVAAAVSYNAGTATLNPSSNLAFSTSYTVNVTSAATDVAGNPLTPFSSTFTTGAAPDLTSPSVTAVVPANGATGVAAGADVVVTFSESMNAATLTSSTFTLTPTAGGSPLAAVVSYSAGPGTATLNPSGSLASNTNYTVNVTSGATDVAGNALTPFSSSFTTADATAPTVTSVSPVNNATGVAVGADVIVTFSEAMNAASLTTSSFTLTPTSGGSPVAAVVSYNAGTATLNPSSSLAFSTSYTVNVTNAATDLAGNALSPFSSTFSTGAAPDLSSPSVTAVLPANGATGVAAAADVVVTFSEPMNAATITTSSFTLTPSGGGGAVAAIVSYNAGAATATLNPSASLATSTTYTVNVTSGATDVAGNPLTAFSSSFTTADVTAPTVISVAPVNNATGVAVAADVIVTFSEPMNSGTIGTTSFTLTPTSGGSPVPAVVSYSAGSATLNPSSSLASSTSYTVNVTSGATDVAGNALIPFSSTFTTADVIAPTVTAVSPLNNATGVAVGVDVVVTFSEPMNAATLTTSTVTLTPTSGGSPIAAVVSYSAGPRTATLNPSSNLAFSTGYTVNVTNGATDAAGNGVTPFSSTFTTGAAPDLTSPTVTNVSPANAATGVAIGADVVVTFSEAMNGASVTSSTFTLTPTAGGSPVAAVVSYNVGAGTATLNPSSNLASSTGYTVNVTSGATDVAGNPLTAFTSSFTTADLTAPTVISVSPVNNATGVAVGADVVVTFSEPMNSGTISATSFTLTPTAGGSPVAAVVSYSAGSATLNPASSLASSTSYTVNVTSAATDAAGNALIPFSSTFTTADVISPTVTAVSPLNSATGVAANADVVVTFSEPMNAATITTSTFTLAPTSGGSPVAAVVTYSAGPRTATLNPSANLPLGTSYTVNVSSGATDVAGNGLTAFSSSFTTVPPDVTAPTITASLPANRAVDVATNAQVRVTFNEPIDPATITTSTFQVLPWEAGVLRTALSGTRSYDAATNTVIFTPSAVFKNHSSYHVKVNAGLKDIAGNSVSPSISCFTPTAGNGTALTTVNGSWAGNNACEEVHWHVVIVQTGDQLSLGDCTRLPDNIECLTSAVSEAGRQILGGTACPPSTLGPPRVCDVMATSLTGSVTGNSMNFTLTMANGLTFTFNGVRSATDFNGNPFYTGTMSGATMATVGMNIQREFVSP